jgi:hypothetical protein
VKRRPQRRVPPCACIHPCGSAPASVRLDRRIPSQMPLTPAPRPPRHSVSCRANASVTVDCRACLEPGACPPPVLSPAAAPSVSPPGPSLLPLLPRLTPSWL